MSAESKELEVNITMNDNSPIIELVGKIIDADVKKLQKKIDQFYKKDAKKIYLDVSKASFMDSHGLGTLVYYHTLMQKEKRELIIVNRNNNRESYLNRLFELTNLDKVLNIVNSL